jgi:hypothetical protein
VARAILFVIHGVGQRAPEGAADPAKMAADTWWREPVDTLLALAKKHAPTADFGLNAASDGVKIVPLSYCDVLVDELKGWKSFGSSDVAEAMRESFPGLAAEYLEELRDISTTDSSFFWSKAVDVLLYRVFLDQRIRAHVRGQIVRALSENVYRGRLPAVSFVSHSLGTAVMHDTLAELLLDPQEFGGIANVDILAYISLANVSKVLSSGVNPHESIVRPFGAPGQVGKAKVRRFINARHDLDPIPYIGLFRPSWDPVTSNYSPVTMDRITDPNTHSFVEYLKHPGVWAPLFEAILDRGVTPSELDALVALHNERKVPKCADALDQLRDEVQDLAAAMDVLKPASVWQAISAFTRAARVLEEARAACAGQGASQ